MRSRPRTATATATASCSSTPRSPSATSTRRPSCVTHRDRGEHMVKVRVRGGYQDYVVDYNPLDVVGWDGYVYPYTFNIADFEPKAGRLHQPPPAHQTFQGPNFVICSFCPRMLDWDPQAVVLPYHHSNVQSEEVMYYVDGDYAARKGVEIGSFTLHPCGLAPRPAAGDGREDARDDAHGRARRDVRHVPAAEADDALARPRRPELRVLLVRGPGACVSFTWVDGERTIHFGPADDAVAQLGGPGYTLLTTPRASAAAPWIAEAAGAVHEVGARPGPRARGRAAGDGERRPARRARRRARGRRRQGARGGGERRLRRGGRARRRARAARCARWPCRPRCRARR